MKTVSSHFKTKKHQTKCVDIHNEKFISDFKDVSDINRDFEDKCKENRYLKTLIYELRQENKELKTELSKYYTPNSVNLIDV